MLADGAVEAFKMPLYHAAPPERRRGLRRAARGVWLPLGLGLHIDLKAENVRLAEATSSCRGRAVLIDLDCVPRTADGGCAIGALATLVNARGTAGWRAPDVVDLLLRDDASAVLTKEAADEVLARQVTWGVGLIRLRLESGRALAARRRAAYRTFARAGGPARPIARPTALVPTPRLPASWLDALPPLYGPRAASRTTSGSNASASTPRCSPPSPRARRPPAARRRRLDDVVGDEVFEALREGGRAAAAAAHRT